MKYKFLAFDEYGNVFGTNDEDRASRMLEDYIIVDCVAGTLYGAEAANVQELSEAKGEF